MVIFSCGKTVAGATDRVKFLVDKTMISTQNPDRPARIEHQSEWETTGVAYGLAQHSSAVKSYHDAWIALRRRRIPRWYLYKALAPTLMCAVLSLAINVIPSEDVADRFSILLTLFLTVYAIQVRLFLPVPPTHRLDKPKISLCFVLTTPLCLLAVGHVRAAAENP
jgi:hypothetical protein